MTQQEAKQVLIVKAGYGDFVENIIDQIFNDHEAIIKAKDEEIERLKAELDNMCNGYNDPRAWNSVKDDDDVWDRLINA